LIEREEILEVLDSYRGEITVATLGSHSALQILRGAKEEGFRTIAICEAGREEPYRRFRAADEILLLKNFKDILRKDFIQELREKRAVIVPHGSLIAYVGIKGIEELLGVPIVGNRFILRWEADRRAERQWLLEAGIRMPKEIKDPREIKGLSMVKFPGAKGGRGYFLVNSYKEFIEKSKKALDKIKTGDDELGDATIQEYIPGVNMYLSYFYSPLKNEVEFFSIDRRYETNIDGLTRIPAPDQSSASIEPSYVVVGNIPIVARESLLPRILEMGDSVVKVSKNISPPGMLGPFCLETMVDHNLEFIAFEISARIVAGTNPYMNGSPYSLLLHGPGMSMGRRIAKEIRDALYQGREEELFT
jgi:5-formaminoimidazole-4-carboxamide-1-(beta)-D-ribofuranosyl 5'-monophosphate synthetase